MPQLLKQAYLECLLRSGVLRFGEFKTKSGRMSPYFFNTGRIDSGESLSAVAGHYADLIAERFGSRVDNLFGPAYKGIPLAVMTSLQLAQRLGRDVSFTFNRKEVKDHGEGGALVGRSYQGGEKVVVIEDVITGGTSFHEVVPLLRRLGADVIGLVVGVDRQERGNKAGLSALREVGETYSIPTAAIVTMNEVVDLLYDRQVLGQVWIDAATHARIAAYRAQYGCHSSS